MKISGSYEIAANREVVWAALNDPEILRECIPGCDSLEMTAENELTAAVTAKVGPVKAKFTGVVELKDLNPPESYRIEGSGKGGAAGFAKGGDDVSLAENRDATVLPHEADAQVGGKLAQIGARLIDGTAKKMADQFFATFSEKVAAQSAAAPEPEAVAPATVEDANKDPNAAPEPAAPAGAEPKTIEESVEAQEEREEAAQAAAAASVAGGGVAPEPAQAASPATGQPARAGLPAWVYLLGAVGLIIVLVALVG